MKFSKQLSGLLQASYSDTFQLLLQYAKQKLKKSASQLLIEDLNYKFIRNFLDHLEKNRKTKPQSLNVRLAAIRSFFSYIEPHLPEYSTLIHKVLSIEDKRTNSQLIDCLSDKEVEALLKAPNQQTWLGRRDHCLLVLAIQTGLRLSEIISLRWKDVTWGEHAYVHCMGKGRKERDTALSRQSIKILYAWSKEVNSQPFDIVFPTVKRDQMSSDAVQYLVKKYSAVAIQKCPSLKNKKVTPHVLRHTAAMRLLRAKVGLAGIALWLGHESIRTTYVYLNADVELKEEILKHINPLKTKTSRYHATNRTLAFLKTSPA